MAGDLEVLIDMGFEKARADMAVKKTGGCKSLSPAYILLQSQHKTTVQGALQWLEDNQDKPLDEIAGEENNDETNPSIEPAPLKEGEVARSMVCNECGKKFRSMAQAEFHASKT
jgi:predicted transcriptional regulator